jgi:hypothetical protein
MPLLQFWRKQKDDGGREGKYFSFNERQISLAKKTGFSWVE